MIFSDSDVLLHAMIVEKLNCIPKTKKSFQI